MQPEDLNHVMSHLETFYDVPDGVLYRLRQGEYDPQRVEDMRSFLVGIHVEEQPLLPHRFVALIWFIPTLMRYQVPRVQERGGDIAGLKRHIAKMDETVASILGYP